MQEKLNVFFVEQKSANSIKNCGHYLYYRVWVPRIGPNLLRNTNLFSDFPLSSLKAFKKTTKRVFWDYTSFRFGSLAALFSICQNIIKISKVVLMGLGNLGWIISMLARKYG